MKVYEIYSWNVFEHKHQHQGSFQRSYLRRKSDASSFYRVAAGVKMDHCANCIP